MSAWADRHDMEGNPHASVHREGHRLALFDGEWWAYASTYQYQPPGRPAVGPEPRGPFATLADAKRAVERQGFTSPINFGESHAS